MLFFIKKYSKSKVEFTTKDFREIMNNAKTGDVIYCDPPYVPLTKTANFTSYSSNGFTIKDQEDLALIAYNLALKGIPVIISNHETTNILNLYDKAKIYKFHVRRTISCIGEKRNKVKEIIAVFK